MRRFILGIVFALIALAAAAYIIASKGYISFRADQQPSALESKVAMAAVDASTEHHAQNVQNPVPPTEDNLVAGAKLYLNHCAGCHGTPSNPDSQFARSFYPPIPEFFKDAPDMPDYQNFYIIQHGIRWTGMPAWSKTLSENQAWQVVAFLSNIEKLPPAALQVLAPPGQTSPPPPPPAKKMGHMHM
jgi:thiosulfate dehydrogenase